MPESDAPAPRPWCPDGPQVEVVALGDRIAELSARIHAATWELLILIRQFDERNGWAGCTSCAEWLGWRTGLEPGAAREHVRVARALADLPKLSDAMRRGKVSYSKMRAVTRVATPETEDDLLNVALSGTAAHVEKIVRAWRRTDRQAEQAEDRRRHETRSLRTWVDENGMVVVRGRLSPEVGAVVRRALEAACDQARGAAPPAAVGNGDAAPGAEAEAPSLAQRQADALGMIAECALSGGLDRGTAGDRYQVVVHVDAEALTEAPDVPEPPGVPAGTSATAAPGSAPRDGGHGSEGAPAAASESQGHGDRRTHASEGAPAAASGSQGHGDPSDVPAGTSAMASLVPVRHRAGQEARAVALRREPGPFMGQADTPQRGASSRSCPAPWPGPGPAASTLGGRRQTVLAEAGGIHISAETARRLACDASMVAMHHDPNGEVLAVGRRTRTISPALRRALNARDRECRYPGCRNVRVDAHHITHWAHGGATALDNLIFLCRRHHRAVHEEGFRVTLDAAGNVEFVRPDGRPLPEAPAPPAWTGRPLAPVRARLEREGIEIDPDTLTPDWRGERLDLDWVIHQLWRPRLQAEATCRRPAADQG